MTFLTDGVFIIFCQFFVVSFKPFLYVTSRYVTRPMTNIYSSVCDSFLYALFFLSMIWMNE